MGSCDFYVSGKGESAAAAFNTLQDDALYESGHGGYTGTIAEKRGFDMIPLPKGKDPMDYAMELMDEDDERVCDKWGPAGCIDCGDGRYLFFGWASS